MSHAALIWANLCRRPVQNLLALGCSTLAFAIYGVMFGVLGSAQHASMQNAAFEQQLLRGAIAVSAVAMALIFLLTSGAMAHTVRLRLHEFGVLKALGFSRRRIIGLVVAEGAVPCVIGAALGLAAVPFLFAALASLVPQLATLPAPGYSSTTLAGALGIALLLPSLACLLPAWRIARLNAAMALTGSADAASFEAPALAHPVGNIAAGGRSGVPAAPSRAVQPHLTLAAIPGLLRQILVVTRIGFSTLPHRSRSAWLITGGVFCTMFVLLWFLCMAEGIRAALLDSGDPARVVLRSSTTRWPGGSRIPEGIETLAASAPGVARAADGSPLAESVFHGGVLTIRRSNGRPTGTDLIGVGSHWREMTPSFRLLSGRLPTPGTHEVIVGRLAQRALLGLDGGPTRGFLGVIQKVGQKEFHDVEWQVVGTFTTGDWHDGHLIGDIATLRQYGGGLTATAVWVRLESPQSFDAFERAVAPRLPPSVTLEREPDNYAAFWDAVPKTVLVVAYVLGFLFASGAIMATMQVAHSALEARRREIATLRVLGFDGRAAAVSILFEALPFAVLGAMLAAGAVWLWRDGELWAGAGSVFEFKVNVHLMLVAAGCAVTIALIGTLPLAISALRRGELEGLKDLRQIDETIALQVAASTQLAAGALLRRPTRALARAIRLAAALSVAAVSAPLRAADAQPPPEATEQWAPIPPVVTTRRDAPPSDAIGLFTGKNLDSWTRSMTRSGPVPAPSRSWKVVDGAMVIEPGAGDLQTRASFGDMQLHLEFRTPSTVRGEGQDRGNSGIFFMGRYELQVLDSYNNATYVNGQAASVYKQYAPLVNASRPPGEWQTLDVVFCAPRFGVAVTPARMTVLHNGVLVQNDVSLVGPTQYRGKPVYVPHAAKLPLTLQDHGSPVAFRNIWVRELACQAHSGPPGPGEGSSP